MSAFVSEKEHDGGIDSGVCPSPDESYQNYDEAFPPLSSSPENNNDVLVLPSSEPSWQFAKRSATAAASVLNTANHRFSSSPLYRNHVNCASVLFNINQTLSNSSPTSIGATPNKRPKLQQHQQNPFFDITNNFSNNNNSQNYSGGGATIDNNNSSHVIGCEGIPFHAGHVTTGDRRCQQRSCPDLIGGAQRPLVGGKGPFHTCGAAVPFSGNFNPQSNNFSSFNNSKTEARPEFCCPIISAGGGPSVGLGSGGNYGGSGPAAFGKVSSRSSPQFVVPKCFKVGSWPTKSEHCSKHANDVPFWSCSEWFCTVHKGVEIGLLSAKVGSEPAKNLAPSSTPPAQKYSGGGCGFPQPMVTDNHEIGLEDNLIDLNWESGDHACDTAGIFICDGNNNERNEVIGDGILHSTGQNLAGHEYAAGGFDAPQFVLHLIENESSKAEAAKEGEECKDARGKLSNSNKKVGGVDLQDQPVTNLDLDTYWPTIADSSNVPEFKFLAYENNNQQQQCPSSIYFSSVQEVGFCLPKFDLSTSQQQQHLSAIPTQGSATITNRYPSPFSKPGSNFKTGQQKPQPRLHQVQAPLQPLVIPPADLGLPTGGAPIAGASGAVQIQAVTVPISPDTHFVPIRSESMEDAYYPKPGFDEPTLFQTYLDETDYYVYLEPDSKSKTVNYKKSSSESYFKPVYTTSYHQQPPQYKSCSSSKKNSKGFMTTIKSSASLFHSLPLKFRASRSEKMVQTEEKYFVYCDEGFLDLENSNFGPGRGQSGDFSAAPNCRSEDGNGVSRQRGDDFSALDQDYDSRRDKNGADFCSQGSAPLGNNAGRQLMEAEFEIWACKSMPLADSLFSSSCWSSADFSDASQPANDNNFNCVNNNNSTAFSGGNIFINLVNPSDSNANLKIDQQKIDFHQQKIDFHQQKIDFHQQKIDFHHSKEDNFGKNGKNFDNFNMQNNNFGQKTTPDGQKMTLDNKDELEMWQKQDEKDEELLLQYVSSISLISPLEPNLDEEERETGDFCGRRCTPPPMHEFFAEINLK